MNSLEKSFGLSCSAAKYAYLKTAWQDFKLADKARERMYEWKYSTLEQLETAVNGWLHDILNSFMKTIDAAYFNERQFRFKITTSSNEREIARAEEDPNVMEFDVPKYTFSVELLYPVPSDDE